MVETPRRTWATENREQAVSEKITCPFCELEGTRESFAFGEKLRCGRCHELFRVEHARLAVKHARLVKLLTRTLIYICKRDPSFAKDLKNALEDA